MLNGITRHSYSFLVQFKENPESWLLVDQILKESSYPQTKCELGGSMTSRAKLNKIDLGLQVLDAVIMTRWRVLPQEQRNGMCHLCGS